MNREIETKEKLEYFTTFEEDVVCSLYQIALSLAVIADTLEGGLITLPVEEKQND